MLYRVHLTRVGFELTLVAIGTDCTGSYKSNYHVIKTMAPCYFKTEDFKMYKQNEIYNVFIVLTDDKDFGVMPPVIFKLKSLQKLDLSFSAITVIPDGIKTLLKLHTLNLEHCPVLTSVSGHVGLLPNLRSK